MMTNPRSEPLRTVLLDVDGTLVRTVSLQACAWHDAFAEAGSDIPTPRIEPLIGLGGGALLAAINPALSDDTEPGKGIAARRKQIFAERYLSQAEGVPHVRAFLERLRAEGLAPVIASSGEPDEVAALLGRACVRDLLATGADSADVEHPKPDPDIIEAALRKSGTAATAAIMIGDTRYDIEAASRAGVPAIAVRTGGRSDEELPGATAIFDDLAALLAGFDRSPLARR